MGLLILESDATTKPLHQHMFVRWLVDFTRIVLFGEGANGNVCMQRLLTRRTNLSSSLLAKILSITSRCIRTVSHIRMDEHLPTILAFCFIVIMRSRSGVVDVGHVGGGEMGMDAVMMEWNGMDASGV